MSLYESKIYLEDLDKTIENNADIFTALKNQSVLITGATGTVCSPVVDLLLRSKQNITVYVAGRNKEMAEKRFRLWKGDSHYFYVSYDATHDNTFDFLVNYIIHGASNSSPTDISSNGIETMLENFGGTYELLTYAEKNDINKFLYISSSEVYGKKKDGNPFKEDEYGWVDILNPRNSYSSSKRAAETLCACFSHERNVETAIVRPGHIYGPTARRNDTHVVNSFAYRAADGKGILMNSQGKQLRSWCYSIDSASAILTVLVKGQDANAYNISNKNSVASIKEMADVLAKIAGVQLIVNTENFHISSGNPMDNSSLDSEKLERLGWQGLFDLPTGLSHTIGIIREGKI